MMKPEDLPALKALIGQAFGDGDAFAETSLCRFAGEKNVFVAEEGGVPVGLLAAVPVTCRGRRGAYLNNLAVRPECRGRGIAGGLLDYAARQLALREAGFLVLIPAETGLFGYYEKQGFQKAFGLRRLRRPVKRNLWAQAEFDSVTAKKLCELRAKFCPDSVQLAPAQMAVVLADLYSQGVTVVSNEGGYGLYFRRGETLHFAELQAVDDRAAETLMEAAREKEVIVEDAEITVGAAQLLFTGEGRREDYGMIRFIGDPPAPFDVDETYLRLMLDTVMQN